MTEINTGIAPAVWQVTASTIRCDMVNDFVTLIVYKDWCYKCTWWSKFKNVTGNESRRRILKDHKNRIMKCLGPDCTYVLSYRNKLISEEVSGDNMGISD
jgi:hypothetical protein